MEQSLPHIPYLRQVFNMGYVHTSIKLIRNTQGGDSIYIYSQAELNTETDSQGYGGAKAHIDLECFHI